VNIRDTLDLLDWRRRVFDLYREVRSAVDPRAAWDRWVAVRDTMLRTHPQSPVPEAERGAFSLDVFDHDPAARVDAELEDAEPERFESEAGAFTRFAVARFAWKGEPASLDAYWLETYGGGVFIPFRDATAGAETYGAGRYVLDTVKGADLGTTEDGRLVLDFNFAYHPSCAHDPRWVCPLAPPANRLPFEVRAGERLRA